MKRIEAFWEVQDFWPMLGVLLLFAAMAACLIAFGPDEVGGEEDQEDPDVELNDLQP